MTHHSFDKINALHIVLIYRVKKLLWKLSIFTVTCVALLMLLCYELAIKYQMLSVALITLKYSLE